MELRNGLLTTDQKGAIAESAIVHAAIKLGIGVLRPVSDRRRYDLVFDLGPELVRVQCKWAALVGETVVVRCYSCRRTRDGQIRRPYLESEIDAVAAYCSALDRCLFFPMSWLREREFIQLRTTPTKNNQRTGVNWLDDFAFERLRFEFQGP